MADITEWSNTAGGNDKAGPPDFPQEGQSRASLNDCMRENMSAVRRHAEDGGWFNWGHTYAFVSSGVYQVQNGDFTGIYTVGRRTRAIGTTTGTIYGTIANSTFNSPHTDVVVGWDVTGLQSEALAISVGDEQNSVPASAGLGTASLEDVGTSVGDVVQLEDVGGGTAGLPAVDGSQLTGVGEVKLETRVIAAPIGQVTFVDPTWFDGTYERLKFYFYNVNPAVAGADFWMRASTNGGSSYLSGATDYRNLDQGVAGNSTAFQNYSETDHIGLAGDLTTTNALDGSLEIFNFADTSHWTMCRGEFQFQRFTGAFGPISANHIWGRVTTFNAVDALTFFISGANITSGRIVVYGLS